MHAVYEKLNEEEEEHVHAKDVWRKAAKKAVETTAHKRLMSKMTSSTQETIGELKRRAENMRKYRVPENDWPLVKTGVIFPVAPLS